jgi:UDP-N-acetylmuramate--alanine ligase
LVVAGIDDVNVLEIIKETNLSKISYGLTKEADYQADEVKLGSPSQFKVRVKEEFFEDFSVFLPGMINVQNSLGAIAVAHYLQVPLEKIKKAISTFKGVKRRFEIVGQVKGVTVIDDYAHHPTKIKKTLAAARTKYPRNKLYCVFEPHTYSRTKTLLTDYAQAFDQADEVIVAELMPSREANQRPIITSREVVAAIKKYKPKVQLLPHPEEILAYLRSRVVKGDVVMIMSVGGLDSLAQNLVGILSR